MDAAGGCVGAGFVNAELCGVDNADIGLVALFEVAALFDAVAVGGCARHFADYLLGCDIPAPAEQEELREKLLRLNEEITKQEEQAENIDRFIGKVRKYLDLDELTPAILNDMVKAVYVHAPDKSKGYREQRIDISYDLVGILPASLLNDLQNGETA